jgi:foldase protein PrsA
MKKSADKHGMMRKFTFGVRLLSVVFLAVLLSLMLSACGYRRVAAAEEDLRTVGRVGNYTVTYDELYFLAMTYQNVLKAEYGEDIFDTVESRNKYREELEELVYRNITANYAVFTLSAEIGYTEDDVQDMVDESMEEIVSSLGGMHAYRKMLHENYMTDRFVRTSTAVNILQSNLLNSYVYYLGLIESEPDEIYAAIMEGTDYIRTLHIAVFKDNGKSDAENLALLQELKTRLDAGEDFEALIRSYGEDTELTGDGYYFTKGEMQKAYEDAAFSLSVGEYSDVISAEDGFYIVKRYPKESEFVLMNCHGVGATLYDHYQKFRLLSMIDEQQEELTFEPNAFGSSIDLTGLRQKTFFDLEYLLIVIAVILAIGGVIALIAWWCVVSIRADRKEREQKAKRRHSKKRA